MYHNLLMSHYWLHSVPELTHYWLHSVPVAHYWLHSVAELADYWLHSVHELAHYWLHSVPELAHYLLNSVPELAHYWLHSVPELAHYWLNGVPESAHYWLPVTWLTVTHHCLILWRASQLLNNVVCSPYVLQLLSASYWLTISSLIVHSPLLTHYLLTNCALPTINSLSPH